ncbi:uncharacterized protein LOC123548111 isoform X2 [Mercenaria mercenaria]|uniref:uncharacterized protein LOC123548111 isoform X2 n=1 Tax=Mercenaria mercenaria TaxID=6596 RepID=UPI00234E9904|nr:uncharacterized protein LOC123548111 isoform X2 [Mercenaria mercenaria]
MAAQCQTNTINTGPNLSHTTANGEAHIMKAIIVISALLAVAIATPMYGMYGGGGYYDDDDSWRYGGYGMIGGGYGMIGGGYGGYGGSGGYGMIGGMYGRYPGMHRHYYWKRRPYWPIRRPYYKKRGYY